MLLGHQDLSTTAIYTHVSPNHMRDQHERFHPGGAALPAKSASPEIPGGER